eukprot:SAG11_NODE_2431_length_3370_cov_1.615102_1_plen_126_part_10
MAVGYDAMTDDLSGEMKYVRHGQQRKVGKQQPQAAIRALIVEQGGAEPATIPGSVDMLRKRVEDERSRVRARREAQQRVEHEAAVWRQVRGILVPNLLNTDACYRRYLCKIKLLQLCSGQGTVQAY